MARIQEKKKGKKYQPIEGLMPELGAVDYNTYLPDKSEKLLWFAIGLIVGGLVLHIFYENVWISLIAGIGCGFAFIPIRRNQIIEKRKTKLIPQFRSLMDALSTSIGAGKNMYDAFASASDDLALQFGDDADIVREVKMIQYGLHNNIQIEDLLMNFADRSGLPDIKNFANVFATCYRKGGNMKDVIRNTTSIIGDKIEIQMELETMVSGQKTEQNIMLVMPVVFVFIMKTLGGEMVDLRSPVGVASVTVALCIFVAAYFISTLILKSIKI